MKQLFVHYWRKKSGEREGLRQIKKTKKNKPLHDRYPQRIQKADVDQENAHQRLHSVGLKAESEGFIMTAQNQSLNTRNYQTTIIKNGVDPKYKICHQYDETVDHLVSGCSAIVLLNIKTDMTESVNNSLEDLSTLQSPIPYQLV